jgi:hypothetical protein
MALTPQHTYQILTKRPERMHKWLTRRGTWPLVSMIEKIQEIPDRDGYIKPPSLGHIKWPLPNVWLGVSVEDQKTADERIPLLPEPGSSIGLWSAVRAGQTRGRCIRIGLERFVINAPRLASLSFSNSGASGQSLNLTPAAIWVATCDAISFASFGPTGNRTDIFGKAMNGCDVTAKRKLAASSTVANGMNIRTVCKCQLRRQVRAMPRNLPIQ